MNISILENRLNRKLNKVFYGQVRAKMKEDRVIVKGRLDNWEDVVRACRLCVLRRHKKVIHVVNDIECSGYDHRKMRLPFEQSDELDGMRPDVLIIGGGISGASIARELSKWKLDILLVEKESDLAMQASGRNDGEIHPGVDLRKGSLKHHYIVAGNRMYDKLCEELDVPFCRRGQYVCFKNELLKPAARTFAAKKRKMDGITDTIVVGKKELRKLEGINEDFSFAIYNSAAGCVCPYSLTIAYAENAVENGAKVCLNTVVLGMQVENGKIISVRTNKGRLFPKIVINAAGVFAEEIARMAKDRFYSIHPRRGTNSILDKKADQLIKSIVSVRQLRNKDKNSKGGGVLYTVDRNYLIGPDAVETYEKEDFSTREESIERVFRKQKKAVPKLSEQDIITYFTGVRAATFEEDFVIEKGRRTRNLIHCAGIQSPGLTTAPAVALDIEKMVLSMLKGVEKNKDFNPKRRGIPSIADLDDEKRNERIKKNPDYGIIICRCEEISKGEIIDALERPIRVPTVDGIKRRVRAGMGRCQGGFCMPLVTKIISEHENIDISKVKKSGRDSYIIMEERK